MPPPKVVSAGNKKIPHTLQVEKEKRKHDDEYEMVWHAAKKQQPLKIRCLQHKKIKEVLVLGGKEYVLPKVWRGHKIMAKSPRRSELVAIPSQYTYQRSNVFLEKTACQAFVAMAQQAARDGISLTVDSGFRSSWYQKKIFEQQLAKGRSFSDIVRYVAPPGYSQHALGTALDLYPSDWRFSSTDMYQWMEHHAGRFGFTESYPQSSPEGFPWEAWHWRYTGVTKENK